jgi:hypothetical protein
MLGYIWMCIGLARFKKWAWMMFITIFSLAAAITIISLVMKYEAYKSEWMLLLMISIFSVSLVIIPLFAVVALIRALMRIRKRLQK